MPNWNELPLEVLIKIFDITVDSYSMKAERLEEYLLISRRWSIASQSAVYKNVRLRMDHFDAFVESMISSNNGRFVKTFTWMDTPDYDILEANLDRLLEACPNVTDLGIGKREIVNGSIFTKLLLVHCASRNGLALKKIPGLCDRTDNGVRAYRKLAYELRKTLQYLQVYDWPMVIGEGAMDETANTLAEYGNLHTINFNFKDHDNICQVGAMIQNCPKIRHLRISPDEVTSNMQAGTTMPIEPSTIHPLPNIHKLCIVNANVAIGRRFLEYVMRAFPKLRDLIVAISHPWPECEMIIPVDAIPYLQQRGQQVSVELWIKFFNYLNLPMRCSVSSMFIKDYLDVFAHFPTFCDSLEIIYGLDQGVPIEPYISVFNYSDGPQILKESNAEYYHSRRTVFYLAPNVDRANVDFKAIVKIFEMDLRALHIQMDDTFGYMLQKEMLCYALENCPELNTLWITRGHFDDVDSDPFMPYNYLDCLRFKDCIFRNDFLCKLSSRLSYTIDILVFNDCFLMEEWPSSFVTIDMPYTSFGCLVWKDSVTENHGEIVFLKITKNKGICSYYKVSPEHDMTVSSSVDFDEAKENDTVFNMHIRCFDIKEIMMSTLSSDFVLHFTDPVKFGCTDIYLHEHGEIYNAL
ncbi:uncharacterized protein EV154DRAFT_581810 [Mucor mucedo]|uniref:uncharacterized protein n=1 Tax=Mucor mucedo TaxID=29922 RepID=UPI00221E947C|nr:uncharacterized protein EV154DRAFT_581810 [Mucor mucedo]KAI7869260.1 hypothetical protein EV154DRAFT_581810 [Mucor mucedo]